MGKLKQMMIAAYEDYEDAAEYEFYMMMEEERKKKERRKNDFWRSEDQENDMD